MWWLVTCLVSSHFLNLGHLNKLYESIWHKPFTAYMWHVMPCRLMDAKPFHEPMQTYCSMDLFEQTLCKYMVLVIYCLCVTLPGFVLRSIAFWIGQNWYIWWLVTWPVTGHYLNQSWPIVHWYFLNNSGFTLLKLSLLWSASLIKDIIKRKRFPYCWASVRGSHWSLLGSLHRDQQCGCLPWC